MSGGPTALSNKLYYKHYLTEKNNQLIFDSKSIFYKEFGTAYKVCDRNRMYIEKKH